MPFWCKLQWTLVQKWLPLLPNDSWRELTISGSKQYLWCTFIRNNSTQGKQPCHAWSLHLLKYCTDHLGTAAHNITKLGCSYTILLKHQSIAIAELQHVSQHVQLWRCCYGRRFNDVQSDVASQAGYGYIIAATLLMPTLAAATGAHEKCIFQSCFLGGILLLSYSTSIFMGEGGGFQTSWI